MQQPNSGAVADAVVLVSFGGPERPEDVPPFLARVTRGTGVPAERLVAVAEHYYARGGVSPINAQNRALRQALAVELAARGRALPVYWGNRNWHPLLVDVIGQMRADGVGHAVAVLTSAYSSAAGCRRYLDDIEQARAEVGPDAPVVTRTRLYFNHPGFIDPFARAAAAALSALPEPARANPALCFVAHSIPQSMAESSGPAGGAYLAQLRDVAELVAARVPGRPPWQLAFCSRSGRPGTPWLGPDVTEHLRRLATAGASGVVVVPIGFVSDHMEVVHDLDTEAARVADALGLAMRRAATPCGDPQFVSMLADLVVEQLDPLAPRPALGALGPAHDVCPASCCPLGAL